MNKYYPHLAGKLPAPCKKWSKYTVLILQWWAREDSNLQPSGYERRNCTEKISNYWHFCTRSPTFVLVWLRRFIGHSLVEHSQKASAICLIMHLGGDMSSPLGRLSQGRESVPFTRERS
jgi:hypothetical protein